MAEKPHKQENVKIQSRAGKVGFFFIAQMESYQNHLRDFCRKIHLFFRFLS